MKRMTIEQLINSFKAKETTFVRIYRDGVKIHQCKFSEIPKKFYKKEIYWTDVLGITMIIEIV